MSFIMLLYGETLDRLCVHLNMYLFSLLTRSVQTKKL